MKWIVQGVFAGGSRPQSGCLEFGSREDALTFLGKGDNAHWFSEPFVPHECQLCGSWLGVDELSLEGGCHECRS